MRRPAAVSRCVAGCHNELNGRENIYLNGALMGRSRAQMEAVYDDIVAFSGVQDFINTPLKYYSSGMRVRLGFAVAIHLEAEIMLLDEIFAVGDEQFQDKCIRRLRHFQAEGRTLILVSHGLSLVKRLCDRALWIEKGKLVAEGPAVSIADQYLNRSKEDIGV
jgi:ABC-type polysaccharide/polyol phosphate transport system ATPase subunit